MRGKNFVYLFAALEIKCTSMVVCSPGVRELCVENTWTIEIVG